MAGQQLWNSFGMGLSLFKRGRRARQQREQEQSAELGPESEQLASDVTEAQRTVLGHLDVTVVQTNGMYGRPVAGQPDSLQQQHKTFEFTVHEGPEEILKLFMHVFGRTNTGRREKHMATALVPITRAVRTGSDSRLVQLIVQPGNRPVAMIQVLLSFRKDGQARCGGQQGAVLEDLPCLVYSAGDDFMPLLAVPDKFQQAGVDTELISQTEEGNSGRMIQLPC